MGNFATFRQAIKDILDARTGTGQPIVEVKDHFTKTFSGYPAVAFEPSDIVSDFETTTQNLRQYIFRIIVLQDIESEERGEALGTLIDIIDTLIDDIDKSENLSGAADFVLAVPMEIGFFGKEEHQTMYAEMKVVCVKSVDIV